MIRFILQMGKSHSLTCCSIGAKKKRHFFECSCLNIRQHFGDDFEKVTISSEEDDEESVSQ